MLIGRERAPREGECSQTGPVLIGRERTPWQGVILSTVLFGSSIGKRTEPQREG